ncbi:MAG: Uma2 family endonuclease [Leptolyngbyaceae cyanobacterium]
MVAQPQAPLMSVTDYLEWEPRQELRYEFIWGEVLAMTGGTIPHNLIALNLYSAIRALTRGQGCRTFVNDVKVQVDESGLYLYPDLLVSCDERDRSNTQFIQFPRLIVEVLSPSTEALDRGDKFAEYRSLPTLQEYVLIRSTKVSVECFRRREGSLWSYQAYGEGDEITLESIGFTGAIALLYEDVDLSQHSVQDRVNQAE